MQGDGSNASWRPLAVLRNTPSIPAAISSGVIKCTNQAGRDGFQIAQKFHLFKKLSS